MSFALPDFKFQKSKSHQIDYQLTRITSKVLHLDPSSEKLLHCIKGNKS